MAEIKLTRIRSIYGEIKGAFSQLPESNRQYYCSSEVVHNFNSAIRELIEVSGTDYSRQLINDNDRCSGEFDRIYYQTVSVRTKFGATIQRLDQEYGFGERSHNIEPAIVINNQNSNNIDINLNFTIDSLIRNAENKEEKENLQVISEEMNSGSADWDRLKNALSWVINYSKELSLKVIPIVLDYYLKK